MDSRLGTFALWALKCESSFQCSRYKLEHVSDGSLKAQEGFSCFPASVAGVRAKEAAQTGRRRRQ